MPSINGTVTSFPEEKKSKPFDIRRALQPPFMAITVTM